MDYTFYRLAHLIGIFMLLSSLGGLVVVSCLKSTSDRVRKLAVMTHGLGMLVIVIAGFGLIAKLGIGFPLWVWIKVLIWVAMGALVILIKRSQEKAHRYWWITLLLASLAGYLALYKP